MNVLISSQATIHLQKVTRALGQHLPIYEISENQLKTSTCWTDSTRILVTTKPVQNTLNLEHFSGKILTCENIDAELLSIQCFIENDENSDENNKISDSFRTFKNYPKVRFYDVLNSTMDVVPDRDGTVVLAGKQLKGLGRKNNKWISPIGTLLMTYNMRCPKNFEMRHLSLMQHIALVASIEALNELGVTECKAKWPNDILIRHPTGLTKIGGILTKSSSINTQIDIQFGIGINTTISQACNTPQALQPFTIENLVGKKLDNLALCSKIRESIDCWVDEFCLSDFKTAYTKCWMHTGEQVRIDGEEFVIVGVDDFGYLEVKSEVDGRLWSVDPANNRFDMMNGMIVKK